MNKRINKLKNLVLLLVVFSFFKSNLLDASTEGCRLSVIKYDCGDEVSTIIPQGPSVLHITKRDGGIIEVSDLFIHFNRMVVMVREGLDWYLYDQPEEKITLKEDSNGFWKFDATAKEVSSSFDDDREYNDLLSRMNFDFVENI